MASSPKNVAAHPARKTSGPTSCRNIPHSTESRGFRDRFSFIEAPSDEEDEDYPTGVAVAESRFPVPRDVQFLPTARPPAIGSAGAENLTEAVDPGESCVAAGAFSVRASPRSPPCLPQHAILPHDISAMTFAASRSDIPSRYHYRRDAPTAVAEHHTETAGTLHSTTLSASAPPSLRRGDGGGSSFGARRYDPTAAPSSRRVERARRQRAHTYSHAEANHSIFDVEAGMVTAEDNSLNDPSVGRNSPSRPRTHSLQNPPRPVTWRAIQTPLYLPPHNDGRRVTTPLPHPLAAALLHVPAFASHPLSVGRVRRPARVALCVGLYMVLIATWSTDMRLRYRRTPPPPTILRREGRAVDGGSDVIAAFGVQHGREVAFPPLGKGDSDGRGSTVGQGKEVITKIEDSDKFAVNEIGQHLSENERSMSGDGSTAPAVSTENGERRPRGRRQRRPAMAHVRTGAGAPVFGARPPHEPQLPPLSPMKESTNQVTAPRPRHQQGVSTRHEHRVERFVLPDDETLYSPSMDETVREVVARKKEGSRWTAIMWIVAWAGFMMLVLETGFREVQRQFRYVQQRSWRTRSQSQRDR